MAISLSAITGAAVSGFTTPGYTVSADNAPPDVAGKQWYVSALTGTQAGVTASSATSPFTILFTRPKNIRTLGALVNGQLVSVPRNNYGMIVRKGMTPLAGQPYQIGLMRTSFEIPAGADTADAANVKALFSCGIGALSQQSSGFADTALTGAL